MPYCGVPLYVLYINIECLMDVRKASTTLSIQGREGKRVLGVLDGWALVGKSHEEAPSTYRILQNKPGQTDGSKIPQGTQPLIKERGRV